MSPACTFAKSRSCSGLSAAPPPLNLLGGVVAAACRCALTAAAAAAAACWRSASSAFEGDGAPDARRSWSASSCEVSTPPSSIELHVPASSEAEASIAARASTCDGRRSPGGSCRGADTSAADGADAGAATTNFDAIGGVAALPGFGRRYCGDIAGVAATGDGGTSCSVGATTGGGGDGASGGDAGGGALDGARVEEEEERARRRLDHRLHLELRLPGGRRAVDAVDVRERQHARAPRRRRSRASPGCGRR